MFSKNNNKPIKAFIKDTKLEECKSVVFSKYYGLPNDQLLYWTLGDKQETTKLKIFSAHDLKTSIREQEFDSEYRLLSIFPDGTLLFNDRTSFFHPKLIKMCSNTLTVLSSQQWKGASSVGAIDNNHFFVIDRKNDSISDDKLERVLTIFNWDNGVYVEQCKTQLSVHPKYGHTEIHSLGKHRYACHLRGHNTSEFRVLIFDIDPITYQVKERGVITPIKGSSHQSAASGECIVLENGQLLTYHHCNDHVQIWDTEDLRCAKEWKWEEIQTKKDFNVWCLKIIPLNDAIHLLVYQGDNYYLFNTDNFSMREIIFNDQFIPNYYGNEHVLANDKIVVCDGRYNNKDYNQALLDANMLIHYDEIKSLFKMSEVVARLFLNTKLPPEMIEHILSYAFTAETEKDFIRQAYDDNKRFKF